MKIVINKCFGGYSISKECVDWMAARGHSEAAAEAATRYRYGYVCRDNRTDPLLVEAVEALGEAASGKLAKLHVVEIPDGIEWELDEYDGVETIHEKHRSW